MSPPYPCGHPKHNNKRKRNHSPSSSHDAEVPPTRNGRPTVHHGSSINNNSNNNKSGRKPPPSRIDTFLNPLPTTSKQALEDDLEQRLSFDRPGGGETASKQRQQQQQQPRNRHSNPFSVQIPALKSADSQYQRHPRHHHHQQHPQDSLATTGAGSRRPQLPVATQKSSRPQQPPQHRGPLQQVREREQEDRRSYSNSNGSNFLAMGIPGGGGGGGGRQHLQHQQQDVAPATTTMSSSSSKMTRKRASYGKRHRHDISHDPLKLVKPYSKKEEEEETIDLCNDDDDPDEDHDNNEQDHSANVHDRHRDATPATAAAKNNSRPQHNLRSGSKDWNETTTTTTTTTATTRRTRTKTRERCSSLSPTHTQQQRPQDYLSETSSSVSGKPTAKSRLEHNAQCLMKDSDNDDDGGGLFSDGDGDGDEEKNLRDKKERDVSQRSRAGRSKNRRRPHKNEAGDDANDDNDDDDVSSTLSLGLSQKQHPQQEQPSSRTRMTTAAAALVARAPSREEVDERFKELTSTFDRLGAKEAQPKAHSKYSKNSIIDALGGGGPGYLQRLGKLSKERSVGTSVAASASATTWEAEKDSDGGGDDNGNHRDNSKSSLSMLSGLFPTIRSLTASRPFVNFHNYANDDLPMKESSCTNDITILSIAKKNHSSHDVHEEDDKDTDPAKQPMEQNDGGGGRAGLSESMAIDVDSATLPKGGDCDDDLLHDRKNKAERDFEPITGMSNKSTPKRGKLVVMNEDPVTAAASGSATESEESHVGRRWGAVQVGSNHNVRSKATDDWIRSKKKIVKNCFQKATKIFSPAVRGRAEQARDPQDQEIGKKEPSKRQPRPADAFLSDKEDDNNNIEEPATASLPLDLQAGILGKSHSVASPNIGFDYGPMGDELNEDYSEGGGGGEEKVVTKKATFDPSVAARAMAESMEDPTDFSLVRIPRKTRSPTAVQGTEPWHANERRQNDKSSAGAGKYEHAARNTFGGLTLSKTNTKPQSRPKRAHKATKITPGRSFARDEECNSQSAIPSHETFSSQDSFVSYVSNPNNDRRPRTRSAIKRDQLEAVRKPSTPDVVEIADSDSELEVVERNPVIEMEFTRIAIGKRVVVAECMALFNHDTFELQLKWKNAKTRATRIGDRTGKQDLTLCLRDGTLQLMLFHRMSVSQEDKTKPSVVSGQNQDGDEDEGNGEDNPADHLGHFLAMSVMVTEQNPKLQRLNKTYEPDSGEHAKKYIVLEFRDELDLNFLLEECSKGLPRNVAPLEIPIEDIELYAQSLLQHSRGAKSRMRQRKFIAGRPQDFTLLVYPFAGDTDDIENAAKDLTEASGSTVEIISSSGAKESGDEGEARKRAHMVSINVEDYGRLEPGEWLNDSLVDLWMQWISRDDTRLDSKFHFFTSHFYSTLESDGPEQVASWTRRKKINILAKKLVFVPIVKQMHWSLCVIVNPGALVEAGARLPTKDDPLSCIIFMDSLRMHNKNKVSTHIRRWLNFEWKRHTKEITMSAEPPGELFTEDNFKIFSPKVPLQDNSYDCGVFVCRYAYAIYELRYRNFTYEDAGMYCDANQVVSLGAASKAFRELISDGAEFDFNMEDIGRFREEFKILIERLSTVYYKWKNATKLQDEGAANKADSKPSEAATASEGGDIPTVAQRPPDGGTESTALERAKQLRVSASDGKENRSEKGTMENIIFLNELQPSKDSSEEAKAKNNVEAHYGPSLPDHWNYASPSSENDDDDDDDGNKNNSNMQVEETSASFLEAESNSNVTPEATPYSCCI